MNNLEFWKSVEKTDPSFTKKRSDGRKAIAIDTYYKIKRVTEVWGMFGKHWGVKNEQFHILTTDRIQAVYYTAILFYPDGEIPIHADSEIVFSTGEKRKGKYNEDWSKKTATDALTKGLSKVGFCADVFLGKFEDSKYVESLKIDKMDIKDKITKCLNTVFMGVQVFTKPEIAAYMNQMRGIQGKEQELDNLLNQLNEIGKSRCIDIKGRNHGTNN